MSDWISLVNSYIMGFLEYFEAQPVEIQVILCFAMVLGCILVGFVLYGVAWLVYQVIKATIVGVILLGWLAGVGIGQLFILIFDASQTRHRWDRHRVKMKKFVEKAYPPKQKNDRGPYMIYRAVGQGDEQNSKYLPSMIMISSKRGGRTCYSPCISPQNSSKHQTVSKTPISNNRWLRHHPKQQKSNMPKFCSTCGSRFTHKMTNFLRRNLKCYCEECGQEFRGR